MTKDSWSHSNAPTRLETDSKMFNYGLISSYGGEISDNCGVRPYETSITSKIVLIDHLETKPWYVELIIIPIWHVITTNHNFEGEFCL